MNIFKNNVLVIVAGMLALGIIGAFVYVDVTGNNTDKFFNFIQWILTVVPVLLVGLVQAKNADAISKQVADVQTATNGALTERLQSTAEDIKSHTTETVTQALNAPTEPDNPMHAG